MVDSSLRIKDPLKENTSTLKHKVIKLDDMMKVMMTVCFVVSLQGFHA